MRSEEEARATAQPPAPGELLREELRADEIDPDEDESLIDIYNEAGGGFEPSASPGTPDWFVGNAPRGIPFKIR
jgi:hypothetical protein